MESIAWIVLVAGIALFGYLVSRIGETEEVTVETKIAAPRQRVWQIMTAWENQPLWRPQIQRVEVRSSDHFIEFPKIGKPIDFRVIAMQAPASFCLLMSGGASGTYQADLTENGSETTVRATERITIRNPYKRFLVRRTFNLRDFANTFLCELKTYVESAG